MSSGWEYLRVRGEPELDRLGAEGWELVGLRADEWIFKRSEPEPSVRFTLEQRDAALADVAAHQAHTRHLLNPEVAALIRRVNHTQMLLIADRGFPVPPLPQVVDLSLTADIPTVLQVLEAVLPDLPADRLIRAEEQREAAPERWRVHAGGSPRALAVPHLELKRLARHAVGCIRTGDATPYANVLLVGG
ncbi:MAG: RbsD/FucU domain-containing protein [Armatimonadota bacterium]